jgi:hypothetical protein
MILAMDAGREAAKSIGEYLESLNGVSAATATAAAD